MRRLLLLLTAVAALLATTQGSALGTATTSARYSARTTAAAWEPLGFPRSVGAVDALAVNPRAPNTVYVGASRRGIYKTTDGGRTWRYLGLRGKRFWSLAIHPAVPGVLYAGISWKTGTGVATSRDAGRSWSKPVKCCGVEVLAFAFDPRDRQVVYAGGDGVSKSRDGGQTWTHPETTEGIGGSHVNAFSVVGRTPETLYAAVGGGGGGGPLVQGVFRSTDAGENWRRAGLASRSVVAVAVEQRRPWIVYAAASRGVFKSDDAGRTWHPASRGLSPSLKPGSPCYVTSLMLDPVRAQTLYLGASCGVFRSTDGARTWRTFSEGLGEMDESQPIQLAISLDGSVLYAVTSSSLARRILPLRR